MDLLAPYFLLVWIGDRNKNKLNHFDVFYVPRIIMLGLDAWENTCQYSYDQSISWFVCFDPFAIFVQVQLVRLDFQDKDSHSGQEEKDKL